MSSIECVEKWAEPAPEAVRLTDYSSTVDRAWARFCGAFGDGPDAPYPGMIAAFETHYGQSFRDKEWRTEAACWAAAWSKATARAGSRSMPDGYVEVAAWLCGVSTKKASQPDADGWIPWAGGKWQTIETAPKDKFVLLCGPSGYTTTPLVFTTGIMRSNYHAGRWIDHANDDLVNWGFEPTHWMPLPTPSES